MEFLLGVALVVASIYVGTHGRPGLAGVLTALAILSMGGGLWRRRAVSQKPPT